MTALKKKQPRRTKKTDMCEKMLNIGVVIADKEEYLPFAPYAEQHNAVSDGFFGRDGVSFEIAGKNRKARVHCIVSKIGKVNAAAAATHLIDKGADIILNFGLSGGVSGVNRGDLVIANRFLEHDFDLTMIGYKPCEKPGQEYIYDADSRLVSIFSQQLPDVVQGTAVCGDRFICNEADRNFLRDTFGAVSCDMETGAIAAVCAMAGIPYIALRRVSDDAGSDAESSYREMNNGGETFLADAFYKALCATVDAF